MEATIAPAPYDGAMTRGPADVPTPDAPPGRARSLEWTRRVAAPPEAVWTTFLGHLWRGGAGFGPRPLIEEPGDAHGTGCTRRIPTGPRGGVRERITATDYPHRLEYRVVNPSWTTYPVADHLGTVAFAALPDGTTEVRWRVAYVPLPGAGPWVAVMTRFVLGRYLSALERPARTG